MSIFGVLSAHDLARLLLPGAPSEPAPATGEGLADTLGRLWEQARAAWAGVDVPVEVFVRHLAARLPRDADPLAALAMLYTDDLYLACACAAGDGAAVALFERRYLTPVAVLVDRMRLVPGLADDLKQMLAQRLLVADENEAAPRVAAYSGSGPLSAWVRVAAVRTAINLRESRGHAEVAENPNDLALSAAAPNPELALLRVRFRDDFREAFAVALAQLDARERNVLRFHYLQGLGGEVLAGMYGVSRRTVHRWLEQSRLKVLGKTRERLAERLVLPARELESIMHALQSELASAIDRFFEPPETK